MGLFDPLHRQLLRLGLDGMADALEKQATLDQLGEISFDDCLAMLLDREALRRRERSYRTPLLQAQLRVRATIDDVSSKAGRGRNRTTLLHLAGGDWIRRGANIIVSGKTGSGTTLLACALAHQACPHSYAVLYRRTGDLAAEIARVRANDRLPRLQRKLAQPDLLVLDDWGLVDFTVEGRRYMLEVVERRERRKSIPSASQIPADRWHAVIGEPTIAEAIVDRLLNHAYRIDFRDPSMREAQALPSLEAIALGGDP